MLRKALSALPLIKKFGARTFLTSAQASFLNQQEGGSMLTALKRCNVSMGIQAPCLCEFTGSRIIKDSSQSGWLRWLLGPKVTPVLPQQVHAVLKKRPLNLRAIDIAMNGSGYTGHHVVTVVAEYLYKGEATALIMDKDDTIFKTDPDALAKTLSTTAEFSDVRSWIEIINGVRAYAKKKGCKLDELTMQELVELKAHLVLGRFEPLKELIQKAKPHEGEYVWFYRDDEPPLRSKL